MVDCVKDDDRNKNKKDNDNGHLNFNKYINHVHYIYIPSIHTLDQGRVQLQNSINLLTCLLNDKFKKLKSIYFMNCYIKFEKFQIYLVQD